MLFPEFQESRIHRKELSYVSAKAHKTVEEAAELHLWMPVGRRIHLWFGVDGETGQDALRLVVLGRDRTPVETKKLPLPPGLPFHLFFGTVLSAVQLHDRGKVRYILSDLHWFRGIDVSCTVEQCYKWSVVVRDILPWFQGTLFFPTMTLGAGPMPEYLLHHHEVRGWSRLGPYVMYTVPKGSDAYAKGSDAYAKRSESTYPPVGNKEAVLTNVSPTVSGIPTGGVIYALKGEEQPVKACAKFVPNWRKPQYCHETRFWIMADPAYDLYKLYARGADGSPVFVDYACVIDRATSQWLNGLFRRILENRRIDAIEESDDEEDFQIVRENKYTDLEKKVVVSCRFQGRLKKWLPVMGSERNQLETISIQML